MGEGPGELEVETPTRILVTARNLLSARKTKGLIKALLPGARILKGAFKGVFMVEVKGEPASIIAKIFREVPEEVGRVTLMCYQVESSMDPVREACVQVGLEHVKKGESFCFRIHKRGEHKLLADTPSIERYIGGAIFDALEKRDSMRPKVNLRCPDVTVVAEVMGPSTAIGIMRKEWISSSLKRCS